MKRIILLLALISFGVSTSISTPAMKQTQNGASAKRTSKSKMTKSRKQAMANSSGMVKAGDVTSVGPVHADKRTKVFYWPDCPNFHKVPLARRVIFGYEEEAEKAGYKRAKNCRN